MIAIICTVVSAILGGFLVVLFSKRADEHQTRAVHFHALELARLQTEVIAAQRHLHNIREMTAEAGPP